MARGDVRIQVKLVSTAGTGTTYMTTKNKRNTAERLELKKYDKRTRRVEVFRESR
jgi:large subunit ribosomal protein L33